MADDSTRVSIARRRLRGLLLRDPGMGSPEDVVGSLTAMQSQLHAYARWSCGQRTSAAEATEVDGAFDAGRILRTHLLRPTWHYTAPEDLRWLMRVTGPRVDAANARKYRDLELDPQVLSKSNAVIARAVAGAARTRQELAGVLESPPPPTSGRTAAGRRPRG